MSETSVGVVRPHQLGGLNDCNHLRTHRIKKYVGTCRKEVGVVFLEDLSRERESTKVEGFSEGSR